MSESRYESTKHSISYTKTTIQITCLLSNYQTTPEVIVLVLLFWFMF